MKYCKSCGNQLTDNAVFCPKCGTRVGNNNNVSPTVENNKPNQEEGLSTWVKIALGVAGIVAFTGICGGFADGMWIAALVSLCALGAVCAVFMGAIEKKYAWTTAIASLLIVLVTIGASAPNENENEKESQTLTDKKEESPKQKKYRSEKGNCLDMAHAVGKSAAEDGANDLIRQGYSKMDLKGIAGQQARLEYKTIEKCCNANYFKENFGEFFTTAEQEKFRQQCIEAYVNGYMDALGKTINK